MPRFINLTPHAITVKLPSGRMLTLPPGPHPARLKQPGDGLAWVEMNGEAVEVRLTLPDTPTALLPDPSSDCTYIVSARVALAYPERNDLFFPATGPEDAPGRDEDGRIVAVTRLRRALPNPDLQTNTRAYLGIPTSRQEVKIEDVSLPTSYSGNGSHSAPRPSQPAVPTLYRGLAMKSLTTITIWTKLRILLKKVGSDLALNILYLYYALINKETPTEMKLLIMSGFAYLFLPFDIVPDMLPGGYADDLAVLVYTLGIVTDHVTPEVKEKAHRAYASFFGTPPENAQSQ